MLALPHNESLHKWYLNTKVRARLPPGQKGGSGGGKALTMSSRAPICLAGAGAGREAQAQVESLHILAYMYIEAHMHKS